MKNKSILLVDDEEIILESLYKHLKTNNFDVTKAESGEKALTRFKERPYDLVITDLVMERMNGIQVLTEVKKIDPNICVIILTGYGDMTSAIDALRLGADDYLLKPCSINELLLRMSRCFEAQESRKKIKLYEKILPLCSVCKKIRDDTGVEHGKGEWMEVDVYLHRKAGVDVSHGLCMNCYEQKMKELDKWVK